MKTQAPAQVRPRRATEQDVTALVHLRSLMFSSMGSDIGGEDAPWRVAAADWLREQLAMPEQFAGFVMEHPADRVVHLSATPEGAGMYQAAGFREPTYPSMRLQLDRLNES